MNGTNHWAELKMLLYFMFFCAHWPLRRVERWSISVLFATIQEGNWSSQTHYISDAQEEKVNRNSERVLRHRACDLIVLCLQSAIWKKKSLEKKWIFARKETQMFCLFASHCYLKYNYICVEQWSTSGLFSLFWCLPFGDSIKCKPMRNICFQINPDKM